MILVAFNIQPLLPKNDYKNCYITHAYQAIQYTFSSVAVIVGFEFMVHYTFTDLKTVLFFI